MKIVLASNNSKKIKELREILQTFDHQLVNQGELGVEEAVEDGLSFVENALIKARHAATITGLPAIADDSGIEVEALGGKPGIYSARFAGEGASDAENNHKLLQEIQHLVNMNDRKACYRCVIVMLKHPLDPTPIIAQGTWQGHLAFSPEGNQGFGYDPCFIVDGKDRRAAQMHPEEKALISHRGQALRELERQLSLS